ncbi:MAG: polysaccharide biosynthesis C-terminal domain-containing protein [Arachidicoccus sp.]|nr:polysaccharide biosynthesis C-terminal domain-containing protein [Arachidicoccus sp.]
MSGIKNLAGQTVWYGLSNVGKKMLAYLLTPLLTYLLSDSKGMIDYGNISIIYAWVSVANVVFTYGMETAYFRFSNQDGVDRKILFRTSFGSIIITTFFLCFVISIARIPIERLIDLNHHTEYIVWIAIMIGLDTLAAIPLAKLRQENRPRKYAFVNLFSIICNIIFIIIFLVYLPLWVNGHLENGFSIWYKTKDRTGFVILANVLENIVVMLLLFTEWKSFRFKIDFTLLKKLLHYSTPMIIIGLAGMVNEVMDREFLAKWLPYTADVNKKIVAIYSANYRFAIFISLFIQAFKMAAEPFFFNQSRDKNAPSLYARIMKWFVITLSVAFLFTALFLDLWEHIIIQGKEYRTGKDVVPILLCANICLGIYYNLSVWYKLTDRMLMGLYITLIGAAITIVGNYFFIPKFGMYASAWSTFICYFVMMIICYLIGQKYFPVPYNVKKIAAYLIVMLLLYFISNGIAHFTNSLVIKTAAGILLMILYILLIAWAEKKELQSMPVIGKYVQKYFIKKAAL